MAAALQPVFGSCCIEMPIPTIEDHKLGEIDDLHACIVTKLRTLRFAGKARDPRGLRELVQRYANAVIDFANELP